MQEVKTEMQEREQEIEHKMRFGMPQAELRKVFEFFKRCLDNTVLFHASEDGVRIAAGDQSHVSLGVVYINKGCMKDYKVTDNHTFALNLDSLKGSLILLKDKQAMVSFLQNGDEIIITGGDGFTKTVPVVDDLTSVKIPEIKYESGGVVDSGDFYAAVNMAADINDTIKLTGDGKNLVVSAYRDERHKIAVEAPLKLKAGGFKGEMTTIPAEYLKNTAAALKHFDLMVRISGGQTKDKVMPLKINFKRAVLNGEVKGYVMIAPRMEQ
jgi:hypothetical protein